MIRFFKSIKLKQQSFFVHNQLTLSSLTRMMKIKALIIFTLVLFVTKSSTDPKNYFKTEFLEKILTEKLVMAQKYQTTMNYQTVRLQNMHHLNTKSYRLPNNTIPLHYDITLSTNIHSGDFVFHGNVRINIKVLKETNTITLHSSQHLVESINLLNSEGSLIERDLSFTTDNSLEFLKILAKEHLEVDQKFIVEIAFSGSLRTDQVGFHRLRYTDRETRRQFWYASTFFEPTHARTAFPCYDEIRYRTTFDIQIIHHQSYHALSNMPVAQTSMVGDFFTTKFKTTPAMPTYNIAFTVSNFKFVSNNNENLPMKVYAQPGAISAGQADNALNLSEKMLKTMEEVFKIPYALPKSDQVATGNRRNSANWGLITVDDWVLLRTNDNPARQRERQLQIAHEFSVS